MFKIVLEGHEFVGKTVVADALNKRHGYTIYRQPGNENIRHFIKEDLLEKIQSREESPEGLLALAYALDRIYQEKFVWGEDDLFIIDRSVFTSLVHQTSKLSAGFITAINSQIIIPDLTFWLRVSDRELAKRIQMRGTGADIYDKSALDLKRRYETLMPQYRERLPGKFFEIFCDRKVPEEIADEIHEIIVQERPTIRRQWLLGEVFKNAIKKFIKGRGTE